MRRLTSRLTSMVLLAVCLMFGASAPTLAAKPTPPPTGPAPAPAMTLVSVEPTVQAGFCALEFAWEAYPAPKKASLVGYQLSFAETAGDPASGVVQDLGPTQLTTTRAVTNNGPGYFALRALLETRVKGKTTTSYSNWNDSYGLDVWTC